MAGVIAATLAIPVLTLAIRQELRATHRGMVEWQDEKVNDGTFMIRNVGLDIARDVTIRAWSSLDPVVTEVAKTVPTGEAVKVHLPRREQAGPDLSEVPPHIEIPRVPDEMPTMDAKYNGILAGSQMEIDRQTQWQKLKAAQDARDAHRQLMVESVTGQQVAVTISWRTKYSQWHKDELRTG
ncbi:hypothetical protein [Kocuria aegyptia]|uniref:hypothetical protein n=1 Tax=Kocuria aegyptia TaxID=330943 RepID=UPI0031E1D64E